MKKQNRFPALAVAVWIMAGSMFTEAQASSGRGGGSMERLPKEFNLTTTTDQKHQTEGIVQGHHGDLITSKMAVIQARQDLLTMMNGERLDEKDVHTAYKALASAEENLTVLRAKILNEVMRVLTPDQQTTIKNKIAKMRLRAQKSMTNLQSKLNTPPPGEQLATG